MSATNPGPGFVPGYPDPLDTLLPPEFRPMRPAGPGGPPPTSEPFFEPAWNGLRVLLAIEGTRWRLRTERGEDISRLFPDLVDVRQAVQPYAAVLDGEVVAEVAGRPDPDTLRQWLRIHGAPVLATRRGKACAATPHTVLYLADILRIGNSWLLDVAWEDRRRILEAAVYGRPCVRLTPVTPRAHDLGPLATDQGLAMLLAKGRRSRYLPGRRSREWQRLRLADLLCEAPAVLTARLAIGPAADPDGVPDG
ncbi:MAG: hypothetical protein HY320_03100 [Armatimonadetes bacterium]|nr:hypothetical protein [Armatimonadota bacterium]